MVEAATGCPSQQNLDALAAWRRQSPAHERAAVAAERFRNALTRLPAGEMTRSERIRLTFGVWWARTERFGAPALAVVAVAALGTAYLVWNDTADVTEPPAAADVAPPEAAETRYLTRRQQQREVTLADGSTLWLDWSSEVRVRLGPTGRHVVLDQGKVAFAVSSDPERPFVVESGDVRTRVTGTEFVVRRRGSVVDIGVIEGSVAVDGAGSGAVELGVAQGVRVTQGDIGRIVVRDLEELGAWRDGLIVFRERPLLEALATLEPYTSYRLDTSQLWDMGATVTGTFFIVRGDAALTTLIETERLEARLSGRNTLILSYRSPIRP